jgi:hypothetical protein
LRRATTRARVYARQRGDAQSRVRAIDRKVDAMDYDDARDDGYNDDVCMIVGCTCDDAWGDWVDQRDSERLIASMTR